MTEEKNNINENTKIEDKHTQKHTKSNKATFFSILATAVKFLSAVVKQLIFNRKHWNFTITQ